jgi:hypothetical protein
MVCQMKEPFVIPVGRDFAPRQEHRWRCSHTALDEVPLSELQSKGLRREVSIYTTHTLTDYNSICHDVLFLGNPLFEIKIPCQLEKTEEAGGGLHRPVLVDFFRISEKLWHSFRPHLFVGSSPDAPWDYWHFGTTELRMLRLDLKLELTPEAFDKLSAAFETYNNNTMPLHLYHRWSYKRTKQETVGDAGTSKKRPRLRQ